MNINWFLVENGDFHKKDKISFVNTVEDCFSKNCLKSVHPSFASLCLFSSKIAFLIPLKQFYG